jgi:hypothetical protein
VDDRAGLARHDADAPRQRRERTLPRDVEEALLRQLFLEREILLHQVAEPRELRAQDDELVVAARTVDRDVAVERDLRAVLQSVARRAALVRALEHHAGDLRAGVLEREVAVAGRILPPAADLAVHDDLRERRLQGLANALRQGGHGVAQILLLGLHA